MQKKTYKKKVLRIISVILVCGLLISILPIVVSSFYSHPLYDDYGYSAPVHLAVQNGDGFFGILSGAFQMVKDTYYNWQGTYAAVFLFSIQPAVFSENIYFLTAVVMLAALILSTMFFVNTVFDSLGYDKKYGVIVSCILLLLSIHFVVNKNEAFFWWNGSSYYTLFYSNSLLLFSFLIKIYFTEKTKKRIFFFILSLLSAVLLGGGNYSTALLTAIVFVLTISAVFKYKKRLLPYYSVIFIVFLVGFIISMIAPGNSVRAGYVTGNSSIKAIILSIYNAGRYISKWTGLAQIAGFSVIAAIAFLLTGKSKYRFRYPLAVLVFSFLIYAAQFTPPLYAMNKIGGGRQIDIYYYSYYLLITLNIFYSCGWLNQKNILKIRYEKIKRSHSVCAVLIVIGVFLCGCLNYGGRNITFVDTALALKNGTPQAYYAEYMSEISEIKKGNTAIREMKTIPDFFAPLLIEEDPNFWINKQIAVYFDVDQITLKTER